MADSIDQNGVVSCWSEPTSRRLLQIRWKKTPKPPPLLLFGNPTAGVFSRSGGRKRPPRSVGSVVVHDAESHPLMPIPSAIHDAHPICRKGKGNRGRGGVQHSPTTGRSIYSDHLNGQAVPSTRRQRHTRSSPSGQPNHKKKQPLPSSSSLPATNQRQPLLLLLLLPRCRRTQVPPLPTPLSAASTTLLPTKSVKTHTLPASSLQIRPPLRIRPLRIRPPLKSGHRSEFGFDGFILLMDDLFNMECFFGFFGFGFNGLSIKFPPNVKCFGS